MKKDIFVPDNGLITSDGNVNENLTPRGNNSNSELSTLFNNRAYYTDYVVPYVNNNVTFSPLFGDLINENALFGLIDGQNNLIYPKDDRTLFKEIPSNNENKKYAMNFVADAFNDMNEYLKEGLVMGKLSKDSIYYDLKSHNPDLKYKDYLLNAQKQLINEFITLIEISHEVSAQVKDPKSYVKQFIMFLKSNIMNDKPVTLGSIILNSNFSNFFSGLVINIADDNAADDRNKFDVYITDKCFSYFSEATKRFGFMVDANVPWRLIVDVNSPAMKESIGNHLGYMLRYRYSSIFDVFSKNFSIALYDELNHLKKVFFNGYKELIKTNLYYDIDRKTLDACDVRSVSFAKRPEITENKFYELFPDTFWMRLYVYLKNYEDDRNYSQQDFENIVREANNYTQNGLIKEALNYVNTHFKNLKNISYLSSLQNINKPVESIQHPLIQHELIF